MPWQLKKQSKPGTTGQIVTASFIVSMIIWYKYDKMVKFSVSTVAGKCHFRLTLWKSRSNKAGLKCLSVHAIVHTYVCASIQKMSAISMKFGMYVEVDEWCSTVCSITRSNPRSRSWVLHSWKSGCFQTLSSPPFIMGAGNWPQILKLGHNI